MKTILMNILGILLIFSGILMTISANYLGVIFVIVGALLLYFKFKRQKEAKEKTLQLEIDYKELLKGNDKTKALDAGRAYYSNLRGGKLTIYDEQALTNDLNSM